VVIDTSVLLNLLALQREHLAQICTVVRLPLHITPHVRAEARRDPRTGEPANGRLNDLLVGGVLAVVELSAPELETVVELVSAEPPDDLDDGEAATLAVALHRSMVAAVDEAKGLRIAQQRSVECTSTLDLLLGVAGRRALGAGAVDAVEAALRYARMRVPAGKRLAVAELLGDERAAKFPQLSPPAARRTSRRDVR
jgi:hypothetical protein